MRKRSSFFLELTWCYKGIQLRIPYFEFLNLQFIVFTKYLDWNVFFLGYCKKETHDVLFEYINLGQIVVEVGATNGAKTVLLSRLVAARQITYSTTSFPTW